MAFSIENHKKIIIDGDEEEFTVKVSKLFPITFNIDFVFIDLGRPGVFLNSNFIRKYIRMKKEKANVSQFCPSITVSMFDSETIGKLTQHISPIELKEIIDAMVHRLLDTIDVSFENIQGMLSEYISDFDYLEDDDDCTDFLNDIYAAISTIFIQLSDEPTILDAVKEIYEELGFYVNFKDCYSKLKVDNIGKELLSLAKIFGYEDTEETKDDDFKVYRGLFGSLYYFNNGISLNEKGDKK